MAGQLQQWSGCLYLDRSDQKLTLVFERPADQRAMANLHALFMGGIVAALLYGAGYAILYAPASQSAPIAVFFITGAALAGWTGASSLLEPDYTTVFDLAGRTVTLTEQTLKMRQRGPVSFDNVAELSATIGYAANRRSVIAVLKLKNGEQWRLGYDYIWIRPASVSNLPAMIADVRTASGLAGQDSL